MSFLIKCNVFPVLYKASRRGLPYNLQYLTRRSIALGCKMKQESQPNHVTIHEEKNNPAILGEYLHLLQKGYYSPLGGIRNDKLKSLRDAKYEGVLSQINALTFLKYCGDEAVGIKPAKRNMYLHQIWDFFNASGIPLDVSHYNTFLKSRIDNGEEIDFEEFIKEMESKNVNPNRVTYQHFLTHYCYHGGLGEATKILETMKANNIPLNEHIFNALILGHSVSNDIAGAEDIFRIMKEKELNISSTTYFMYLKGLARSGNISKLEELLEECSSNNINFSLNMKFDIAYDLIISGHKDFALKMLLKESRSAVNLSPRHEIVLEHRLLHKMRTDALTDVLAIFSDHGGQRERSWLAYCYILHNEGLVPLFEFHMLCQQKGIGATDKQMKDLLRDHNAVDYDDLEPLAKCCRANENSPNYIFIPFLNKSLVDKNAFQLARTLRVMRDNNSIAGFHFLKEFVADKRKFHPSEIQVFMGWMRNNGLPRYGMLKAFLASAVEKGDLKLTLGLLGKFYVPDNISGFAQNLARAVQKEHTACVAACLKAWYFKTVLNNKKLAASEPEPETVSLTEERSDFYASAIAQILNESEAESPYDILQELANMGVPLPAKVIASLKKSWPDEKTRELIDNLQTPEVKLADARDSDVFQAMIHKGMGRRLGEEGEEGMRESGVEPRISKSKKESEFDLLVTSGNLTEAMEQLNTDEDVNTYYCYSTLVRELVKCGEEEKVVDVLKKFVKTAGADFAPNEPYLYLEREMLKRKMFHQFQKLCFKRYLNFNLKDFLSLLPIMKSFDKKELSDVLTGNHSHLLTSSNHWLVTSFKVNEDDLGFKILSERMYRIHFHTIQFEVLPFLYGEGRFDAIERILAMSNKKSTTNSLNLIRHLCSDNLSLLRLHPEYDTVRFVEGIENMDVKCKVVEKLLELNKLIELKDKAIFYQILLGLYQKKGEKPEKCLELWYKQQEENLIPTKVFLIALADILKKNDMPVEFQVPMIQPLSLKDFELTHPAFPGYLNHHLNSLKNDDTRSDRLNRLTELIRLRVLHPHYLRALGKRWKKDPYLLELYEEVKKNQELWVAFVTRNMLPYLMRRDITTKESFKENVNIDFLATCLTKRQVKGALSSVVLWFYWSRIDHFPELLEMVAPKRIPPRLKERLSERDFLSYIFRGTRQKLFYEFLKENNLILETGGRPGLEKTYEETPSSLPEMEEVVEEVELFEKDRLDKDTNSFGGTRKTTEET